MFLAVNECFIDSSKTCRILPIIIPYLPDVIAIFQKAEKPRLIFIALISRSSLSLI